MFAHSGSGPFAGAPHRGRHGRRPCARGDGHDFIRVGGWPVASLADLDDGLGNTRDLAVEEVLHLLEFKLTAGSDRHERRQLRHSKSTDNFKVFRMRL